MTDRWYVPLGIAAGAVMVLLVTGLAVVEVLTSRAASEEAAARWQLSLERLDDAILRRDFDAAKRQWRDAYAMALRSRQWDALIEVGDSYRRLGRAGGFTRAADAGAREAYFNALLRARRDSSLDGVLRTGEAFAELGDTGVVEQCLHLARELAERDVDPAARQRVKFFSDRWTARSLEAERGRAVGRP
jgi:hypothetical protein